MTDIKDNPPPLPEFAKSPMIQKAFEEMTRPIEAAAFERGKAAMQGEIDRLKRAKDATWLMWKDAADLYQLARTEMYALRAKLKALEEQEPVAWRHQYSHGQFQWVYTEQRYKHSQDALYLSAGAKE